MARASLWQARQLAAPFVAALLLLASVGCQRSLDGANCECVAGWTCCHATNKCLPNHLINQCSDPGVGGTGGETRPADGGDGSASPDGDAGGADARPDATVPPNDSGVEPTRDSGVPPDMRSSDGGDATAAPPDAGSDGNNDRVPDGSADGLPDGSADGNPDAPMDPPRPDVAGLCTSDGWCWTHPLPIGERFVKAFGIGADEVWALSASGAIAGFHSNGTWDAVPSPMTFVYALWGLSSTEVYAGGADGVYRWDGHSWQALDMVTSPQKRAVYAIWGCGPGDFWAVGNAVGHWKDNAWSLPPLPDVDRLGTVNTVWGSACNDVFAGGTLLSSGDGEIIHWDGSAWSSSAAMPSEKIVGTAAGDVWSLAHGAVSRWDGQAWTPPPLGRVVWDLFPAGPSQIGILDDAHTVTLFKNLTSAPLGAAAPAGVTSLWGRSAADLWGMGSPGALTRWTGNPPWNTVLQPWSLASGSGTRVTGTSATDLWAAVGGTLLHGDGSTWHTALTPAETGGRIPDIWARAPNDVRVLGGDGVIHRWDGSGVWRTDTLPPATGTSAELRAISGSGPNDVWVVRGSSVLHSSDGTTWVPRQPSTGHGTQVNPADVWAAGPNEAWVVGDGIAHWLGNDWAATEVPQEVYYSSFSAVAGGGGAVFFVTGGYVLEAAPDGKSLSVVSNADQSVAAVHVVGPDDAWFLWREPDLTRVYHYTLPLVTPGKKDRTVAPAGMNDIWVAPDGTPWLAGEGGALLRHAPDY
jgi:hypothetical protein